MLKEKAEIKGFTLIEVVAVLIVLSILAAVAVTVMGNDSARLAAQTEALKANIRYSQALSMTTGRCWGIRMNETNGRYWIFNCDDPANCPWDSNRVCPPGMECDGLSRFRMGEDFGVSLSFPGEGNSRTLSFDDFGRPFWDSSTEALQTLLASDLTLTLTDSPNSTSIIIRAETGFVP